MVIGNDFGGGLTPKPSRPFSQTSTAGATGYESNFFPGLNDYIQAAVNAGLNPYGAGNTALIDAYTQTHGYKGPSTSASGSGAASPLSFSTGARQSQTPRSGSGSTEPTEPTGPTPLSFEWFQQQSAKNKQEALDTIAQGISGITGGADEFLQRAIQRLAEVEAAQSGELGTQVGEGRSVIDEATARAMQALTSQGNPYANLQMVEAPTVANPLATYMSQSGASAGAVNELANMLNASNAASTGAFQNLKNLMSASTQAATQGRATDIELARAASMRDLEANRRALSFAITQNRIGKELEQMAATNEIKRNAELAALQQRLGVNQQYGTADQQFYTNLLSLLFQNREISKSGGLLPMLGLTLPQGGIPKPR